MDALSNPRLLILALSCLAASAAGGFLGGTLVQDPPVPAMPPPLAQPDPTYAIAELGAKIDALRSELLQALDTHASRQAAAAAPVGAGAAAPLPSASSPMERPTPSETPAQILQGVPRRGKRVLLPEATGIVPYEERERLGKSLAESHLLWSIAELTAEYGRPDKVSAGDGTVILGYRVDDWGNWVRFWVAEGVVWRADIHTD